MIRIKLSQGKYALIDNEDLKLINKYKWCLSNGYAATHDKDDHSKTIFMHRLVNRTLEGFDTDHINLDRLDNRRENLRTVTRSQNQLNRLKLSNNTSGFKGISWFKRDQKWKVVIMMNKKSNFLGYFTDIKEATNVYNEFVERNIGMFGVLNNL